MTFNEEQNIERCLLSVRDLVDEMFVLDSHSTDTTIAIARDLGAKVASHDFDNYASQRRRLISMAAHDWQLTLDADEYLSEELRQSVLQSHTIEADAFTSNRKSSIDGHWIHHGSWYPDRKIRLYDRKMIDVEGHDVHESIVPKAHARILHLTGDLMHQADEDIDARYKKVNLYSTRAAESLMRQGKRTHLLKVACKPCWRFLSSYILKAGFLDGFFGYVIAKSEAHYVWLRESKLLALQKRKK